MRLSSVSNISFGNKVAQIIAKRASEDMKKDGIRESITRNNHMNQYGGEKFSEKKAQKIVSTLRDEFGKADIYLKKDIVDWCIDFADNFYKHPLSKDKSLPEKTRDAVIVDYLNRVALDQWLDLGLYTKDLKKTAPKKDNTERHIVSIWKI